jgi:hypothetical protein
MNADKIKKLFAAARNETAPLPSANFADGVLRAVRREPPTTARASVSIFDQLNVLFPRLALAAAAVIVLCIAADFGFTSAGLPELDDGAAQLSAQFDLNGDEL